MKLTNGIKIAMANKPLCYKMLFSRVVITLIACIACFLCADFVIKDIFQSSEVKSLITFGRDSVKNFILMNEVNAKQLSSDLNSHVQGVVNLLKNMLTEILVAVIIIVLIIQIAKFFVGLCDYVIAVNVNEHMSSMRHAQFFTTLIEHFKPACRFALYCVISLFLYNLLIISVSALLFILLIKYLGLFTLTVVLLFYVLADAFRLMCVGMIPPKMVCENYPVTKAIKESFKGLPFKEMRERFLSYFIMRLIHISVTVICALSTLFVSLVVTIPFFAVAYMAMRFVDYYTVNHKKYYVTFDEIVIPKELRNKGEQLLNKVDIEV